MIQRKRLLTQFCNRRKLQFSEFHFGSFCLNSDLTAAHCGIVTEIYQIPVYPYFDGIAQRFDNHLIPLSQRIFRARSEEHTSELQSRGHLVCRLVLEKK